MAPSPRGVWGEGGVAPLRAARRSTQGGTAGAPSSRQPRQRRRMNIEPPPHPQLRGGPRGGSRTGRGAGRQDDDGNDTRTATTTQQQSSPRSVLQPASRDREYIFQLLMLRVSPPAHPGTMPKRADGREGEETDIVKQRGQQRWIGRSMCFAPPRAFSCTGIAVQSMFAVRP